MACAQIAMWPSEDDEYVEHIPLVSGSVAEFYIEPMLTHVHDVDVMFHSTNFLAIPRGHPPPTQLPNEFHSYVKVGEITDSHLPGYVYLPLRYLLTKFTDSDRYNDIQYEEQEQYLVGKFHLSNIKDHVSERHGPGTQQKQPALLPIDVVPCIRCLLWPPQAAGWPSRHKNYGWPDSSTVNHVVSNGCDVVQVAHRQCKQDEWMNEHQWRLSFSRAEIALINSWLPLQQIIYHLLRTFMKTEHLTESANNLSTLSNYHIKTLMLWACEMKPKSWWTDDLSLVRICVQLLHTLAVWLTEAQCPQYFIINCNLVDRFFILEMTVSRLLSVDKNRLCLWFVNSYIKQSVQICPQSIARLFNDVSTHIKLENAVSAVVDWRLNTTTMYLLDAFVSAEFDIAFHISTDSVNARSYVCSMTELSKLDVRLCVYFTAIAFLHVSHKIGKNSLIQNSLRTLSVAASHFVVSSKYYNRYTPTTPSLLSKIHTLSRKCLLAAANQIQYNTSELVELLEQSAVELLTTFRHSVVEDFRSVATIVTTDFEALYAYKRGDYQRCLLLSTQSGYMLLTAERVHSIHTLPELIQLLDSDIVSMTALTLIISTQCRRFRRYVSITQLTLSLYLMTQCQLKLCHSVTSLSQTLDHIEVARNRYKVSCTLDLLTLKMIEHKLVASITT